jgi:hypothetical protein
MTQRHCQLPETSVFASSNFDMFSIFKFSLQVKPSEFVPTNLAVNFKQPNRFKSDDESFLNPDSQKLSGQKRSVPEKLVMQRTVVVGQMPIERVVAVDKNESGIRENDPVRATDDVHVQKFKKHFQRK